MTTREEAARLADALEPVSAYGRVGTRDVDQAVVQQAVQMLRQWPKAGEPVALQHVAVAEDGVLRWMSGRKLRECELYAMPDGGNAPALYAAPPAAPGAAQPSRPDEFVCPHCFYEGAAPQPAPSGMVPDTAWLIEWQAHGYGPQWWGFNHPLDKSANWCADANNAIRFSRQEDAERMRLHVIAVAGFSGRPDYQRQVTVTEHMWPAAAPQAAPQPLTRDQIDDVWNRMGSFTDRQSDYRVFARAIERAHGITAKEKPHG